MATITRPTLSLKRPAGARNASGSSADPRPAEERFWFVWSPTEYRPKRRHASLQTAEAEARRLAAIAPDKRFLVFEARLRSGAP